MLNIGPLELVVILLVALVIVGPQRLPEIGRSIGRALHDLRKVQSDVRDQFRFDLGDDPPARPARRGPRKGSTGGPKPAMNERAVAEDREREAAAAAARAGGGGADAGPPPRGSDVSAKDAADAEDAEHDDRPPARGEPE